MGRVSPTPAADFIAAWSPGAPERARSLPSAMYTDPGVFALERARVFGGRTWIGVGGLHQLPEPGTYFTADVAGEPILVLNDADGAVHAFFNVCPHRGGPLARGAGKLRGLLQCLYHGWTFRLDGGLLRARDFGHEVDPTACRRRPVRVESWLESLFVALDPATPPLHDYLGDLKERIERDRLAGYAYAFSKDFELSVNWKVAWETAAGVRWDRPYFKTTYLLPLGVDATLYRSDFYVPRERLGDEAWLAPLHAAWDDLNRQDRQICDDLQRGVRSMAYQPGPLSVRWERSLHHFHGLLMTRLRGEAMAAKEES